MNVCARCDSGNIVPDYEKGKQVGVKCMMCGHDKFKEVDMSNRKCEAYGCEKKAIVKGVCYTHYHEKFGKAYKPEHRMPRKANKGPEKVKDVGDKLPIIVPLMPQDTILLDFTGYKDLFAAIQENAKNEMRSPAMQILWVMKTILEKANENHHL